MSLFDQNKFEPEVEETKTPSYESRVYEVSDDESTIFSAPTIHKDRVKKGKSIKEIILASVALLLVGAIIFGIIKYLPTLLNWNQKQEVTYPQAKMF